jgi:hypothetical protein
VDSPGTTTDHFDLLPFISILMCVLGCLLLVTISMSAISMGAGATEAWTTHGLGAAGKTAPAKEPILVDWDGKIARFQLEDRELTGEWSAENPDGNRVFQGALRIATSKKASSYLLVAVRPSGFATLVPLLDVLRTTGLDVGYEPVEQGRAVSLRSAKKAEAPAHDSNSAAKPAKEDGVASASDTSDPKR